MKANEFSIGNLITVHGHLQEVCNIPLPDNCTDKNTKPIPLTEEWLVKCSIEYKTILGESFQRRFHNNIEVPSWVECVHEAQNWYYWNNNKKELPINL